MGAKRLARCEKAHDSYVREYKTQTTERLRKRRESQAIHQQEQKHQMEQPKQQQQQLRYDNIAAKQHDVKGHGSASSTAVDNSRGPSDSKVGNPQSEIIIEEDK